MFVLSCIMYCCYFSVCIVFIVDIVDMGMQNNTWEEIKSYKICIQKQLLYKWAAVQGNLK